VLPNFCFRVQLAVPAALVEKRWRAIAVQDAKRLPVNGRWHFLLPNGVENYPMARMRNCVLIVAVMFLALKLSAADTNAPASAKIAALAATNYYDQVMVVTGQVAQVSVRPGVTFLNLDRPYPESPFTVVIFPGRFVADLTALKGRSIEIKGPIQKYHDRPEIVMENTNQLTVLGAPIPISMVPTNAPVAPRPATPPAVPTPAAKPASTNFPEIM
jgi:hypothetical protein